MPRIPIPDLGSVGVVKDVQPHELSLSALSDVRNIRMRDGSAERISGEIPVFTTPPVVPYGVSIYPTASSRFIVTAGLAAIYADDGSTQTNITGTTPTGGAADRWSGGILNGVLVLNNGADQPMYWGGAIASPLATVPAWTSTWRCAALRPFKNYLVGMGWKKGTTLLPNMVKWSSAADPGTMPASWNEADTTVDAGETDLSETSDVLVDGLALGDTFAIYKTASMYAMTYIGGQYIWQFRKLPGEAGMLARGCACNTPMGHLVLTSGDLIVHNGMGPTSILSGKMRKWLFATMDANFYARSFLVSSPGLNEAWVCFPEQGSAVCTKALIWNWVSSTFTLRDLNGAVCGTSGQFTYTLADPWSADAASWDSDITVWDKSDLPISQSRIILGNITPALVAADAGSDFSGMSYNASVERVGLDFDDPGKVKLLKAVYPRIDGATGSTVYIQAGAAMDVEGSYSWGDAIPYVIGTTYRADLFASGRFLAYRIYSIGTFNWRVKSIDFDVDLMGEY